MARHFFPSSFAPQEKPRPKPKEAAEQNRQEGKDTKDTKAQDLGSTRRQFLRASLVAAKKTAAEATLAAALGLSAYEIASVAAREYPESISRLAWQIYRGRVIKVTDANKHHHTMLFNVHGGEFHVRQDKSLRFALPPQTQALLVESSSTYLNTTSTDGQERLEAVDVARGYAENQEAPWHDFVAEGFARQKPLILWDVYLPPSRVKTAVEYGPGLLALLTARYLLHHKTDRRQFLKLAAAGLPAAWAAGSKNKLVHPPVWLDAVANEKWSRRLAEADYLIEQMHPESYVVAFRNQILAAKLPDFDCDTAVFGGKVHWTVPLYLQEGQEKVLERLKLYSRGFVRHITQKVVADPRQLYTSVQVTRDTSGLYQTKLIRHPRLQEIFG